ncbi:glutamine--fructose-6-phosphate transaminase (isomerizing) [Clostridium thermosuccinogenes]|uniref:Glutamine--fructose-6-phosphate aminotransferase [isomerizing] n=1 Tax=Clostridium thermosuccinogenes TaxID=84032 RepID=A0A2K2FP82_9CLOT|nr:glutamine--fructose-6-phosphate transaminase (isomerizing) [Pseudoclostridium thermosuccinogenes]AUS96776.1 glutamine--fructose-6-phosphate transaminase (isomerizing) [Pseudoclostridium thermosuccinogenes]PNT94662.1 glutamine--fructose-6-phosphate transaminase (isomerizing) [Pseudoclostridium thermosuccinogenes]PNU00593.1 glutamine--fructose-6-phosphate transaminase (isomerizing) [Pseudoclostridium thermosuccinogenes]
MCGIVGYIGERCAAPILINGLKKLEYRGYDSAGVAVFDNGALKVVKCKGRLKCLEEKVANETLEGKVGIGHTRWATHGEPNDVNSHPHISNSGKIAVVHNGIIENYIKLKEFLQSKGYNFESDTDTEVVAHLVDYNYKGDLKEAVMSTISELEGSYALGVICSDCPDMFLAARKDSPLIVGLGRGENFIASDIPAILEHTRDIYILEDKEIAVLDKDNVKVFNIYGTEVKKEVFHVNWDVAAAEKSGYKHFMMKEMCEEPKVLKDTISPRIKDGKIVLDSINIEPEYLENINRIHIVACGTAYHAGVVGKYLIEKLARIPVEVDVASEFRYRDPLLSDKDLVIIISQSGETIDTLFALRESKRKGARVLSIVNVVGSSIARESDEVLYTWAGPEIAVASTKAYNTQLAVLYLIACDFAKKRGTIDDEQLERIIEQLKEMPSVVDKVLQNKEAIQKFSSEHYNAKSIFFIGRGLDYALSMEGSLKLKEISYIHSEAYAGGELKHGTIALIEKGTLVVCPMTQDDLLEKMISNIREVKARGAVVLAITQEKNKEVEKVADVVIKIPDVDPLVAPIAAITSMQLFAYYMAVQKGCDVDKPRNLAKSVTVE